MSVDGRMTTNDHRVGYVLHFRDLEVYRRARSLAGEIHRLSEQFPPEERYALTDQVRRAARSVGAQLAEAWARRRYPKHFVSKLADADGEQLETQHWLITAGDCGYLPVTDMQRLLDGYAELGRRLGAMTRKADAFADRDHSP